MEATSNARVAAEAGYSRAAAINKTFIPELSLSLYDVITPGTFRSS
jgi:hypothetical protein